MPKWSSKRRYSRSSSWLLACASVVVLVACGSSDGGDAAGNFQEPAPVVEPTPADPQSRDTPHDAKPVVNVDPVVAPTSIGPCLTDATLRAQLGAAKTRTELQRIALGWVTACPKSSKAWTARAVVLQEHGLVLPDAIAAGEHALKLDQDWDSVTPALAEKTIGAAALLLGDNESAQQAAKACSDDKGTGAACRLLYRMAGLRKAAPPKSPDRPTPSGPVESGAGACAQPEVLPVVPNPAYALALQAEALQQMGQGYQAFWIARDCVSYATTNGPAPHHAADPRPEEPNASSEQGDRCGGRITSPYVDSATLSTCREIEDATGVVHVAVGSQSVGPVEQPANAGTTGIGVAFGASAGNGGSAGVSWGVYRVSDEQGQSGWAISFASIVGEGLGASAGAGGYYQWTNANSILDLQGPSQIMSGGGIAAQPVGASYSLFQTLTYQGFDLTAGFAGGLGEYFGAFGGSYTWVFPDAF